MAAASESLVVMDVVYIGRWVDDSGAALHAWCPLEKCADYEQAMMSAIGVRANRRSYAIGYRYSVTASVVDGKLRGLEQPDYDGLIREPGPVAFVLELELADEKARQRIERAKAEAKLIRERRLTDYAQRLARMVCDVPDRARRNALIDTIAAHAKLEATEMHAGRRAVRS